MNLTEEETKIINDQKEDAEKDLKNRKMRISKDVPKAFEWNAYDAAVADLLIENEKENPANLLTIFNQYNARLSDFAFWYLLRVCWLRFPSPIHQDHWGRHFCSPRLQRQESLMRPSECDRLRLLPNKIPVVWEVGPGLEWCISYKVMSDDCLEDIKTPFCVGEVSKENVTALFHGIQKIKGFTEKGEPIFEGPKPPDQLIILNPEHVTVLN